MPRFHMVASYDADK